MSNTGFVMAADTDEENLRCRRNRHLPGVYDPVSDVRVEALPALLATVGIQMRNRKYDFERMPAGGPNLLRRTPPTGLREEHLQHR